MQWHRGHLFHLTGSPDLLSAPSALVHEPDAALLVDDDGVVAWCGPWAARPSTGGPIVDHHGDFILPGFVDTHVHYPQVHCVDAYGGGELLDWLTRVVFPAEARLAEPGYAEQAASAFCTRLAAVGTTTALVFGSQFPSAQQALADEAGRCGLRIVTGRTLMTSGPGTAEGLGTDVATAEALSREEIERWLPGAGTSSPLTGVALVPRFALSVDQETLAMLGDLYEEYRDDGLYVTTHLSESRAEGEAVAARFGVDRYLDVYDGRFLDGSRRGGASLLGRRTVVAHGVHCRPAELRRLAEAGSSIAHCPVSQDFLGSGTLEWTRVRDAGTRVAMGSDVAAGDEWFMPRVLNACYKAHMNERHGAATPIDPATLLYLGTLAGAQALDLDDRVGSLDPGRQADFVVIDPSRCPELAGTLEDRPPADSEAEAEAALLFSVLMAAREPAVAEVYVGGRRVDRAA